MAAKITDVPMNKQQKQLINTGLKGDVVRIIEDDTNANKYHFFVILLNLELS